MCSPHPPQPRSPNRGPVFAREQALPVRLSMCVFERRIYARLYASPLAGEPFARRDAHAHSRIHAARHENVQKGRDWQCRGPTCPLPQHGHAPRGSTWPFSSSGWCATVKPAPWILRGISVGADATNKSCIIDPYLRVRCWLFLIVGDAQQCSFQGQSFRNVKEFFE